MFAGAAGLEPATLLLERRSLPLAYAPIFLANNRYISFNNLANARS